MVTSEFEVGKPITVHIYEGLYYSTPPIPKLNTIRGYKLKKEDQVWIRDLTYTKFDWNDNPRDGDVWYINPAPGQMEWYYAEIDRILNGEWVMIQGKPIFLNHFCYFYSMWFVLKEGGYPEYRDSSLEFFRFIEVVFNDPKCRGANMMKGRRKGVSTMCMSIMLQFGLIKKNTEQGITSKSAIDAEKIFKLMLVNGYSRLPSFLKPRLSGTDTPVKTMHITKQAGRITKEGGTGANKEGLNNKLEWRAPSLNVFDGDGLWLLLLDEAAKWEDVNIDEYLEIALNIITAGKQIGRIIIITTVNRGDKGGDNYKPVWQGSDQTKLNVLGQTENKLYRHFMPGYMGGRDGGWIDKYGNSVWDTPTPEQTEYLKNDPNTLDPYMGCKEYCELQRKLKDKDPEKLQEEIRMFPFNPEEVFNAANNKCHFTNPDEINDQIERIEAKLEDASLYRRGWFKKDNNGDVEFKDDPDGLWYILELLDPNMANKWVWKNGHKTPNNTDYGAAGVDTFSNSESTAEKGSDAAMVVHKKYNILDPDNSGMPVALFIGRPKSKRIFNQQIFWGAEYYGIKMLIERAPTDWYDYADKEKVLGYCLKTKLKINGQEVYGCAPQDHEAREQHLTEMVEYIGNNVYKVWFLRILRDLIPFNVKDRTKYDGAMAFGYALMACKDKYRSIVPPVKKEAVIKTFNLFSRKQANY